MGAVDSALPSVCARQRPLWVPDDAVNSCQTCKSTFKVMLRRHHCRYCGQCFCNRCTRRRVSIEEMGYSAQVRICENCHVRREKIAFHESVLRKAVEDEQFDVVELMDIMTKINEEVDGDINLELWREAVQMLRKKSSEELETIHRNLDLIIDGEAGVVEEVCQVVTRAGKFQQGIRALEQQGVDEFDDWQGDDEDISYSVKVDRASRMLYHMELSQRRKSAEDQLRKTLSAFNNRDGILDRLECIVLQEKLNSAIIVGVKDAELLEVAEARLSTAHTSYAR